MKDALILFLLSAWPVLLMLVLGLVSFSCLAIWLKGLDALDAARERRDWDDSTLIEEIEEYLHGR